MRDVLAAWGLSGASLVASLSLATDILQFVTALLACISGAVGLYLLIKKARAGQ